MTNDEYDECRVCWALTDSIVRHKRWHEEQDQLIRQLRGQLNGLEGRVFKR
jgi:hypothetical protein